MRCPRLTRSDDVALSIVRRCKFEVEVGLQSYAGSRNHAQLHLLTNAQRPYDFSNSFMLSFCLVVPTRPSCKLVNVPSRNRVSADELRLTIDARWKLHYPVSWMFLLHLVTPFETSFLSCWILIESVGWLNAAVVAVVVVGLVSCDSCTPSRPQPALVSSSFCPNFYRSVISSPSALH